MIEIGRGGNQAGGTHSDAGWMMARTITCLAPLCGQFLGKGSSISLEASSNSGNGAQFHWLTGENRAYPSSRVDALITDERKGASGLFETTDIWMAKEAPYRYKVFITHGNAAGSWGNYKETAEAMKKLELGVAVSRMINWQGSAFSDIILPTGTWAEQYGFRTDWEYAVASEPAIDLMFECKSDIEILKLISLSLAKKLNLGVSDDKVWPWKNEKEFISDMICTDKFNARVKERVAEGKFVERFAPFVDANIDFMFAHPHGIPNPYFAGQLDFVPYTAKDYVRDGAPADDPDSIWFPTDGGNGKALFVADFLPRVSLGELPALPIPCEPQDSWYAQGNPIESGNWDVSDAVKKGFNLVACGKAHENWQFLSMNQDTDGGPGSRLLREAFQKASDPICLFNPVDAEKLGIKPGDRVTIESLYGKSENVGVMLTQTVMPNTIVPPIHWAPQQTEIYPNSLSLGRLDPSVRNRVAPPLVGPYSGGGVTRTLGGAQNCQSAVLCKVYKS